MSTATVIAALHWVAAAVQQRLVVSLQLSEERLVGLLEQISEKNSTRTKVTIQRRRPAFDDDF